MVLTVQANHAGLIKASVKVLGARIGVCAQYPILEKLYARLSYILPGHLEGYGRPRGCFYQSPTQGRW